MKLSSLFSRFPNFDANSGFKRAMHKFHKDNPISLSIRSIRWPHSADWIAPDFPRNRTTHLAYNIQGIAHDNNNWFFTNYFEPEAILGFTNILWVDGRSTKIKGRRRSFLWKISSSVSLNHGFSIEERDNNITSVEMPTDLLDESYWHYGDLDYYNGYLFVPVEGVTPGKIALHRGEDLHYIGSAKLEETEYHAPWCAINPRNGLLYTSTFYDRRDSRPLILKVYEPTIPGIPSDSPFSLTCKGDFQLYDGSGSPLTINRIQGGTFDPDGNLYLVSDSGNDDAGIHAFDMIFGRRLIKLHIKYDRTPLEEGGPQQELEGITFWDLIHNNTPDNIPRQGELHLTMLNIHPYPYSLYIKHIMLTYWRTI
jgi:hypothetical protein